ncbi:unnamed protein product [Plutella xylostella]|uniref:(diamondback moth) hypothetical protein n=1 Tax=Plutella xylostella TaxID=51655 RepID=A0A8S4DQ28_PLUXY|nr:unnamed protein product [Plutella xylostella]
MATVMVMKYRQRQLFPARMYQVAITWRRSILSDLNAVEISRDEANERARDMNVWRKTVKAPRGDRGIITNLVGTLHLV